MQAGNLLPQKLTSLSPVDVAVGDENGFAVHRLPASASSAVLENRRLDVTLL